MHYATRRWLYSWRYACPSVRASGTLANTSVQQLVSEPAVELIPRTRSPTGTGLDGQRVDLCSRPSNQPRMAWAMNSGPLSLRMCSGTPRTTWNKSTSTLDHVRRREGSSPYLNAKHSRVLIHDQQPLQRPPVLRPIKHKVPGPYMILVLRLTPQHRPLALWPKRRFFLRVLSALSTLHAATADVPVCD